jgi:hypothetical protein
MKTGANDKIYRIYMLPVDDVKGGWYDGSARSVNIPIYARTQDKDKAYMLTREEALYCMRVLLEGWPRRCEPPITVTY